MYHGNVFFNTSLNPSLFWIQSWSSIWIGMLIKRPPEVLSWQLFCDFMILHTKIQKAWYLGPSSQRESQSCGWKSCKTTEFKKQILTTLIQTVVLTQILTTECWEIDLALVVEINFGSIHMSFVICKSNLSFF